jgi:acetoin utilization protein AcuB
MDAAGLNEEMNVAAKGTVKKRMPTIKSVMTPFPYTIEIDDSVHAARTMMDEHSIHHLPVADAGRLVGIVLKRDVDDCRVSLTSTVRSCYVPRIYVVGVGAPLDAVLFQMAEHHIGTALVVKGRKLAGIFTETDAFQHFAEFLQSHYLPSPDSDDGGDDQVA